MPGGARPLSFFSTLSARRGGIRVRAFVVGGLIGPGVACCNPGQWQEAIA